jgi:hypothetical protein
MVLAILEQFVSVVIIVEAHGLRDLLHYGMKILLGVVVFIEYETLL